MTTVSSAARTKRNRGAATTADRPLLTKREAMEFFRVSARTLDRMVSAGKICPIRVTPGTLRYRRSDLEAYVASCSYERGVFGGAK